jgi:predicted nucleic acid-binding protein
VHVPHVFDLEVIAAIRRYVLRGALPESRADRARAALGDLRATRYSHAPFRARIWELRANLTPDDAAYVVLAEALEAPPITQDARLADAAGAAVKVELHL